MVLLKVGKMSKGQPGPQAAQSVFAGAKGGSSLGSGGGVDVWGPRGPCENAESRSFEKFKIQEQGRQLSQKDACCTNVKS